MFLEIQQEVRPVSRKAAAVEVGDGEREAVVDADDGRSIRHEFRAKPLGETTPRPVPAWTGRWLNLFRVAGAPDSVNPEPFATGIGRHRAGIVDADVA